MMSKTVKKTQAEYKTIVITGASDGLGAEAAKQLKELGHNVIITGRTPSKVKMVAQELGVPYHIADYSKLSDVVRLAEELSKYLKIDVLANNAGAIMKNRRTTQDGFELTFQVNVLAQYLLTRLLADKLTESNATVIQTTSMASKLFGRRININDIQNEGSYTNLKAYGESKLCNILFTVALDKKYRDKGIASVAFEPGIPRTNFAGEGPLFFKIMYHSPFKYLFTISKKRSARRLVRLAVGKPNIDFVCSNTYSYMKRYDCKYNSIISDSDKLWDVCEQMTENFLS